MRYAITADLHVMYKGHSLTVDGIPENIYFPLYNLQRIVENKDKYNIEGLIIAGDLIMEKSNIHQMVLTHLLDTLEYCSQNLETIIIAGNHDYIKYGDRIITFLEKIDFCHVILPGQMDVIGDVALISHGTKDQFLENFSQLNLDTTKLIVSHFGITEAEVSGSLKVLGEFSVRDFKYMKDTYMILGHYHKPQKVTDNIYYVGSPVPVERSEAGEEKRYLIFDTETLNIESVPTVYPRYIQVNVGYETLDVESIVKDIQDNLNKYLLKIPHDYPDKKTIKELAQELPGYVFVEVVDTSKLSQTSEESKDISYLSIKSIANEYLTKKGVSSENFPEYIREVEDCF